ncbi:AcvB/VirJ family lysyl-phosphatidylglycerol hydrolase [Pararhodospirillum oryzae]|uniref:Virulence factor n=1 Tax=Pararhodospirillum oryzae TaxID=478448 RepID=A0A512H3M9_9PROT|nr:AcvB/VirJ family lysyl-phosphatidylglycerol hydrolase [Pararhodospirillum oryzae]GEO80047.1 virulence factor [Pararhodospirillum oryzae]
MSLRYALRHGIAVGLMSAALLGPSAPARAEVILPTGTVETGNLPLPRLALPQGSPRGFVFLFSGAQGWGTTDEALAARWRREGVAVIGLDTPAWLARAASAEGECADLAGDLEGLSQTLQQALGQDQYRPPVVAGLGMGGTVALAALASAPVRSFAAALAVDPAPMLPLGTPLCRDQKPPLPPGSAGFGFPGADLADPATVVLTPTALPDARAQARLAHRAQPQVRLVRATGPLPGILDRRMRRVLWSLDQPTDTSVVPLPAAATQSVLAIVYSGDGGWRDLDRDIARRLQAQGIPALGIDSLRAFWKRKTPEEAAAQLSQLIRHYTEAWGVNRVLMIGYSFGADLLPETLVALPAEDRARIAQVSLLALSPVGDFEINPTGWMGQPPVQPTPTLPALRRLDPSKIQCLYGRDEAEDSACPGLESEGVEVVVLPGGHHFDGAYGHLTDIITTGLKARLSP